MTDEYRLVYTPDSIDDLRKTYAAIVRVSGSNKVAGTTINNLRKAIRALKHMPNRHEVLDWEPWKSRGVRHMAAGSYTVLYVVNEPKHAVELLRVFFGSPRKY